MANPCSFLWAGDRIVCPYSTVPYYIAISPWYIHCKQDPTVLETGGRFRIYGILLVFLLTGGLAVLRHSIIRLLLWLSHTFPGPASQFLNDATARVLLQRIGGGYSFIHRLLLDHLADTDAETTSDVDALSTQPLRSE